jgi:hypothetical protein
MLALPDGACEMWVPNPKHRTPKRTKPTLNTPNGFAVLCLLWSIDIIDVADAR